MRTRSNAALRPSSDVRSIHTHSAAGGGACEAIRSKPTKAKRPASRFISAEPIKPLLPVTITTSPSAMKSSRGPHAMLSQSGSPLHQLANPIGQFFPGGITAHYVHELPFRVDQVEEAAVVDEIILAAT